MSHVATIEVDVKDLASLGAACTTLGLELIQGQQTYQCWGTGKTMERLVDYQNSSRKQLMPDGFRLDEMGHCEHAIRVKKTANLHSQPYEIGLVKRRDGRAGYMLLCDLSGAYDIKQAAGDTMQKLKQQYAVEVAVRAAKRAGLRVIKRELRVDGSIAVVTQR